MGDKQHGHAGITLYFFQQRQYPGLGRDVQRGSGFVGNQQIRFSCQRHRQHDPLFHTTGELVGIFIHALRRIWNFHRFQ